MAQNAVPSMAVRLHFPSPCFIGVNDDFITWPIPTKPSECIWMPLGRCCHMDEVSQMWYYATDGRTRTKYFIKMPIREHRWPQDEQGVYHIYISIDTMELLQDRHNRKHPYRRQVTILSHSRLATGKCITRYELIVRSKIIFLCLV